MLDLQGNGLCLWMVPSLLTRFLQVTQAESLDSEMIRPCNCRGTIAHVHTTCLNRWRTTNVGGNDRCPQCLFVYQRNRADRSLQLTTFCTGLLMAAGETGAQKLNPQFAGLCVTAWVWCALVVMVLFWAICGFPFSIGLVLLAAADKWHFALLFWMLQIYFLVVLCFSLLSVQLFLPLSWCGPFRCDAQVIQRVAQRHLSEYHYFEPVLSRSEETYFQACVKFCKRSSTRQRIGVLSVCLLLGGVSVFVVSPHSI